MPKQALHFKIPNLLRITSQKNECKALKELQSDILFDTSIVILPADKSFQEIQMSFPKGIRYHVIWVIYTTSLLFLQLWYTVQTFYIENGLPKRCLDVVLVPTCI